MFSSNRARLVALGAVGLALAGLVSLYYLAVAWAAGMFSADAVVAHQIDYQRIEIYSQRQATGVYVVSDSPDCGRQAVDFNRGERFGFATDSLWVARMQLSASDQDRYWCFKVRTGLFPFRQTHYLAAGPIDTTPPVLSVQVSADDLVLGIDWLSGAEMNLRRPNNRIVVRAARLQPDLACDKSAREALANQPPAFASSASHPDHLDLSPYLLTGPGSTSDYDSPAQLTLAAIPLAELSRESDYCFYVYDSRLSRDSGSYLVYSPDN